MAPLTFASLRQFEHFSFTFIDAEDYAYAASERWPKVFISILFKPQISNEIVSQRSLDRSQPALFSFLKASSSEMSENTEYVQRNCWGFPSFEKETQ